jgi:hypothetical protein
MAKSGSKKGQGGSQTRDSAWLISPSPMASAKLTAPARIFASIHRRDGCRHVALDADLPRPRLAGLRVVRCG